MKRMLALLALIALPASGAVPQFELDVDSQKPAGTWTLKCYRGATPWIKINLYEAGVAWYPTNAMSGFFWYGTNANWNATSTVQVACSFATNASYTDIYASPTTFAATGTFYGGLVMTNASGTEITEWGRGYVQVLPSGGIGSSGLLDLREVRVLPVGALIATNTGTAGQTFSYSSGNPLTGTVTGFFSSASAGDMQASIYDPGNVQRGVVFTNDVRYLAALTNPAAFATAAQGAKADVIETNYASLSYASQAALAAYQDATNYSYIATTNEIAQHNTNGLAHLNLASIVYVTNQLAGYVATNGNGAGVTNVNAATLQGYTVSQLTAPSSIYYVWGSLFSGFDTPVSNKLAQLASPAGQPVWTSTIPNVINATNMGYASVKTNERPRILKTGLWKVHLSCLRSGNVQPRTMRAHLRVYESNGSTVVTNLSSDIAEVSEVVGNHSEFVGTVPSDIVITDSLNRYIQIYFETVSGWTGAETLYVYSQNGELTYIELPSVGVLVEAIDSTARTNAAAAQATADAATNAITAHTNNVSNPHATTAAQVGAVATNDARYLATITNNQTGVTISGVITATAGNVLTNGGPVAVAATNAQARVAIVETNTVTLSMTNGWVTSSHASFVQTNDVRYLSSVTNNQTGVTLSGTFTATGGNVLTNGGPVAVAAARATNVFAITEDPSGFAGETDNSRTYSFDATQRVLTVSGASTVYRDGAVLTNFTTCTWPAIGTNSGIWYLYWSHATGTQVVSQTSWALDDIQQATVWWQGGTATVSTAPTVIIGEETHGFMPWTVHRRWHSTDGSVYASGLDINVGAKSFTNSSGVWFDEDIQHQVGATNTCRVLSRAGITAVRTQYCLTNGAGGADLMYDLNGTNTTVTTTGGGFYANYWQYAVPGTLSDYIWVAGRTIASTTNAISSEAPYDLSSIMPFSEAVLLYRVTLRNSNPPTLAFTTDYRKSKVTGSSFSPTVHATLSGRDAPDSHPLAAITSYETLATTTTASYAAAPVSYAVTIDNSSAVTWTNTWSPFSNCASVTFSSTGVVTHLYQWPTNQSCTMQFLMTCTGTPSMVWPSAVWLTNGIFSSTAGTVGRSNLVTVQHTPYLYLIYNFTNGQTSTWGTP